MSYLQHSDVLDIYVEPYIQSGFRLPNQPYSYYYRSLFSLHNETLSVWTHLVGAFIIILQMLNHIQLTSSPYIISYIIYNGIGACVMLLCSAQAHLFHSRNLQDHLRLFYLDYLGINFYGFISGIVHYRFSRVDSVYELFNESTYYSLLSCLSLYSLSIACFCKFYYRRPYPFVHKILQCSGVLIVYVYQIWPIILQIIACYNCKSSLKWHFAEVLSFIASGTVFVLKFPERFHPGTFDLIGQSHHTFHGFIFLMGFFQSEATYRDMLQLKDQIKLQHLQKDIIYACVILTLELLIIYVSLRLGFIRLEKHYEKHLEKLHQNFNRNDGNITSDDYESIKKIE